MHLTCNSTWPQHTLQSTLVLITGFKSLSGLPGPSEGEKSQRAYCMQPTTLFRCNPISSWAIRTLIEYAIIPHSAPGWTRTRAINTANRYKANMACSFIREMVEMIVPSVKFNLSLLYTSVLLASVKRLWLSFTSEKFVWFSCTCCWDHITR